MSDLTNRAEVEAELKKPGRLPNKVLAQGFVGAVRDWVEAGKPTAVQS